MAGGVSRDAFAVPRSMCLAMEYQLRLMNRIANFSEEDVRRMAATHSMWTSFKAVESVSCWSKVSDSSGSKLVYNQGMYRSTSLVSHNLFLL